MSETTEDNEIGKLEGQVEIERVILQEEVKTFSAKVALAYFDGPVFDFSRCTFRTQDSLIPVYDSYGKKLGFANVYVDTVGETSRLVGDMSIDYACEERLLIENGDIKYYARVSGFYKIDHEYEYLDFKNPIKPHSLVVTSITLTTTPGKDPRLGPVGSLVI
jgi:hypothetical protein